MTRLPLLALAASLTACAAIPANRDDASIAGALRLGQQPVPPLRICAHPVGDDGVARCTTTPAGATTYRLEGLAEGRYHVLGWVMAGELRLLAHAQQIRCIRAPCPPDRLLPVDVAAGAALGGVDLQAAYADIPTGWPTQPPP